MLRQTTGQLVKRYAVKAVKVVGYVVLGGLLLIGAFVLSEFMGWSGVPTAE